MKLKQQILADLAAGNLKDPAHINAVFDKYRVFMSRDDLEKIVKEFAVKESAKWKEEEIELLEAYQGNPKVIKEQLRALGFERSCSAIVSRVCEMRKRKAA